ncbi:MAG: hypothetical protein KF832_31245 [Caldilineaceae bacterium]|nr:hypothetical protein [Caldilineaceae bacterium]
MEITVTIPPSVEKHLITYAASLFYETSPYAISRAIVCALVNQLDTACLVSRDEIVTGILDAGKPLALPTPVEDLVVEAAAAALAPPTKTKAADAPAITDPKKLKVPSERFQGEASNTWLVWGWCMASSLNLVTPDSGARKFHSFNLQDTIQGIMQRKSVRVKDTTAYSALDALVKRQWLNFNSSTKLYSLTPIAQKWTLTAKNQSYLIDKGFLEPIIESDMIT